MIGDGPVVAAQVDHGGNDVVEGIATVAPLGMVVKRAAEFGPFDQAGNAVFCGGLEFALVFAQLRRDEIEVELVVDFLLGGAGQQKGGIVGFGIGSEQTVFVEAQSAFDGALAHDDVVFLASGEIGQSEWEFRVGDDAQIGLNAALQDDAGLGVATGMDQDYSGQGCEKGNDGRGVSGGSQEIDVSDDFLVASKAACGGAADHVGVGAQLVEDGVGGAQGEADQVMARVFFSKRDAIEDLGLGFRGESREFGDLARLTGGFQLGERGDVEFVVEDFDLFRSETGHFEQFQQSGGQGGFEFVVVGERSGGDQLSDLVLEGLAESFDLAKAVFSDDGLEALGQSLEGSGGVGVGAGFERVFALEFQKNPNFSQNGGHLIVVHADTISQARGKEMPKHGSPALTEAMDSVRNGFFRKEQMSNERKVPTALTVAGSDSGGGAGVQADLKTFAALGVHGTSAITCVTAQNPKGVLGVQACRPDMVALQMEAVMKELGPKAIKTGMLYSAAIIREVAGVLRQHPRIPVVVDPVMVSTSGAVLLKDSARKVMEKELFPLAALITPNLDEAGILTGTTIREPEELRECARALHARYGCAILVKGGHLKGMREAVDLFFDGRNELLVSSPFVRGVCTHGTGCTYSAAIAACLAHGQDLDKSVELAKEYISEAITQWLKAGRHTVLNHWWQD